MADAPLVLTGTLDPLVTPDLPVSPDPLEALDLLASPDPLASLHPLELPALLGVQELAYKVLPPLVLQPLPTIKPDKLLLIRAAAML